VISSLAAKLNADLVTIGSVRNTGIEAKIIWSSAEKTMRLFNVDLVILTPN
jgi:nucleotide-binding universal stress UspA family protein